MKQKSVTSQKDRKEANGEKETTETQRVTDTQTHTGRIKEEIQKTMAEH